MSVFFELFWFTFTLTITICVSLKIEGHSIKDVACVGLAASLVFLLADLCVLRGWVEIPEEWITYHVQ